MNKPQLVIRVPANTRTDTAPARDDQGNRQQKPYNKNGPVPGAAHFHDGSISGGSMAWLTSKI